MDMYPLDTTTPTPFEQPAEDFASLFEYVLKYVDTCGFQWPQSPCRAMGQESEVRHHEHCSQTESSSSQQKLERLGQ